MKRLFAPVCLIACLFIATSCDSTIADASAAIRRVYERLNGTAPKSASTNPNLPELETVEPKPLNATEEEHLKKADELIELARSGNPDPKALGREVVALRQKLDREFPPLPPVSGDSMMKTLNPPAQIGDFKLVSKAVSPSANNREQELLPGIWYRPNSAYKFAYAYYKKPDGKELYVNVVDRGNLGAWARTAHWVYLTKGTVGTDEAKAYHFVALTEHAGHQWVVWETETGSHRVFLSQWKDRWEIILAGAENLDAFSAINPQWLETVK